MEQDRIQELILKIDNRLETLIPDVVEENSLRSVRAEEHVRTLLSIREHLCSKVNILDFNKEPFVKYTTGYVHVDPVSNMEEQNEG